MALNLKCATVLPAGARILLLLVLALAAAMPAEGAQVDDATATAMAQPQELIVAGDLKPATRAALLKPVDAFYGFWINGSQALLDIHLL